MSGTRDDLELLADMHDVLTALDELSHVCGDDQVDDGVPWNEQPRWLACKRDILARIEQATQ